MFSATGPLSGSSHLPKSADLHLAARKTVLTSGTSSSSPRKKREKFLAFLVAESPGKECSSRVENGPASSRELSKSFAPLKRVNWKHNRVKRVPDMSIDRSNAHTLLLKFLEINVEIILVRDIRSNPKFLRTFCAHCLIFNCYD